MAGTLQPKAIDNCDHEKLVRSEDEPRTIEDEVTIVAAQCVQCGGRAIVPEHETSPCDPVPTGEQETLPGFGGGEEDR